MPNAHKTKLERLALQIRRDILVSTTTAGSGHPSSSLSAVELVTALFFGGMFRADLGRPNDHNNDRFILSKGHAVPLLYALYAAAGRVSETELKTLRRFGSRLEGHPMPVFPFVDVPTGSLGQGLAAGVGMALAARMENLPYQTYVLLGDSEMSEGSVWEAIALAAHLKLGNLTGILDVNRLGQTGPTMLGHDLRAYARRLTAFGWNTVTVDGHDCGAVLRAFRFAQRSSRVPTMVIAKTIKGKGVKLLEDKNGWHGKALDREQLKQALAELGGSGGRIRGKIAHPIKRSPKQPRRQRPAASQRYSEPTATRTAFANALVRLVPAFPQLVVLDGEVKNSTGTEAFAKKYPRQFVQSYIAEQAMVNMATGLAACGKLPVAATFAAFFSRAADQLRMAQYAESHMVFVGTHAGVAIGPDGPSQMGLSDVGLFRNLQNSTVLAASDPYAAERLLESSLQHSGIVYLRLPRGASATLYSPGTKFPIGGSITLRRSPHDRITLVGSGTTTHTALAAAGALAGQGIAARVIDLYSIKPIDAATLKKAARDTKRLIVVEDHVGPGGIGEAMRTALGSNADVVTPLCVNKQPKSGTPEQQLRYQGIDAAGIVRTVHKLLKWRRR